MDTKKAILTALACLLGVALVCVVQVDMINGTWPWSGSPSGDYSGMKAQTTESTNDPVGNKTEIDFQELLNKNNEN